MIIGRSGGIYPQLILDLRFLRKLAEYAFRSGGTTYIAQTNE
jgi:hypothetical protein